MNDIDRSIAPAISWPTNVIMPSAGTIMLDNGVPMTIVDNGCQDVYRITLLWDGGMAESMAPTVANLAIQSMREGSSAYSGEYIANALDGSGSWLKGIVQPHNTAIVLHGLKSTADAVMPVLYDLTAYPVFPEPAVTATRESYAGALETNLKRVDYLSQTAIRSMMFGPDHNMSREETPGSIRAIRSVDLADFHGKYMQPTGLHVYLAGKVDDSLISTINRYFGNPIDKNCCRNQISLEAAVPVDKRETYIDVSGAMQSSVRMAIPVVGRNHPDYINLRIATIALGGYFGSRLMTNIREEKGLTYGINAGLYGYREGAMIMVGAQTSNETVRPLIDETCNEMDRLKSGDITSEELMRLKRFMITQLLSQLDTPFSIMDYYENLQINDIKGDYFKDQIEAIDKITPETIGRMAEVYFNTDLMKIAVAGDLKQMGEVTDQN